MKGLALPTLCLFAIAREGLGLSLALTAARWLSTLLFGVNTSDPVTLLGTGALLGVAVMAASYAPARQGGTGRLGDGVAKLGGSLCMDEASPKWSDASRLPGRNSANRLRPPMYVSQTSERRNASFYKRPRLRKHGDSRIRFDSRETQRSISALPTPVRQNSSAVQ
jgi:hypothetical protein